MDERPTPEPTFPTGISARVELTVTDSDTAQTIGSGDVPVLATPRVVALAEAATVAATTTRMAAGMTTVGVRVELEHRAATAVGGTVVALAQLAKVDGRRLLFEVSVTEGSEVVAEGRVERVLVDRQRFLSKAFDRPAAGAAPSDPAPSDPAAGGAAGGGTAVDEAAGGTAGGAP